MATGAALNDRRVSYVDLQCPLCCGFLKDSRVLPCEHKFCKTCLVDLENARLDDEHLLCPICDEDLETLSGHNIESLDTDTEVETLINDFKIASLRTATICTLCKPDDAYAADVYCMICDEFMCSDCHGFHGRMKKTKAHQVTPVKEILSGAGSLLQQWQTCEEHSAEDMRFVCVDCETFTCQLCLVMRHKNHKVFDADVYENRRRTEIRELEEQTTTKVREINKHREFIKEKQLHLDNILETETKKIKNAFNDAVKMLCKDRDLIVEQCSFYIDSLKNELARMDEDDCKVITQLRSTSHLISSWSDGIRVACWDPVKSNKKLCADLHKLLQKPLPDYDRPEEVTHRSHDMKFHRNNKVLNRLGSVEVGRHWYLKSTTPLPARNSMVAATAMKNEKLGVGLQSGGVHVQFADGDERDARTFLKSKEVADLCCLPNGRLVVRNTRNDISIYRRALSKKMETQFDTLDPGNGHEGGMDVDKDGYIYVAYKQIKVIQIFSPDGGTATKTVNCAQFLAPEQVCAAVVGRRKYVIAKSEEILKVVDVDRELELQCLSKPGLHPFPACCKDGAVLVAWISHEEDQLVIEKFNFSADGYLTFLETLINMKPFPQCKKANWYYLAELSSRVIALCTPDETILFHEEPGWVIEMGLKDPGT